MIMHRFITLYPEEKTRDCLSKASEISNRYQIPIAKNPSSHNELQLILNSNGLFLKDARFPKPLQIDFSNKKFTKRLSSLSNELIAKAVGIKKSFYPKICDATAGLGRDAFVLASFGCKVTLIERSPILAAMLENALEKIDSNKTGLARKDEMHDENERKTGVYLTKNEDFKRVFNKADRFSCKSSINLIYGDSIKILNSTDAFDVIYLDSMFPVRTKSANVKKEMRILQKLLGQDDDAEILFKKALKIAKKRVVVKKPLHAKTINNLKPNIQFKGKSCRFDVYWPNVKR